MQYYDILTDCSIFLTACGGQKSASALAEKLTETENITVRDKAVNNEKSNDKLNKGTTIVTKDFVDLPNDETRFSRAALSGDYIYMAGKEENKKNCYYKMDINDRQPICRRQ